MQRSLALDSQTDSFATWRQKSCVFRWQDTSNDSRREILWMSMHFLADRGCRQRSNFVLVCWRRVSIVSGPVKWLRIFVHCRVFACVRLTVHNSFRGVDCLLRTFLCCKTNSFIATHKSMTSRILFCAQKFDVSPWTFWLKVLLHRMNEKVFA